MKVKTVSIQTKAPQRKLHNNNLRPGIAAFTVLFIAVAAAIIALGLISRADRAMATGKNVAKYMQTNYLAESGLTHAKTLLMYPQNIDITATGYWQGDTELRIEDTDTESLGFEATGSDKYDITITQEDSLTYDITSYAYCLDGTEKTARYCLNARLHLDPCITYWQQGTATLPAQVTVNGDVYCNSLSVLATINGDIYTDAENPVNLPGLAVADFSLAYYIIEDYSSLLPVRYLVEEIAHGNYTPPLTAAMNPAGVYYCPGSLTLEGDFGDISPCTFVVADDLILSDSCKLTLESAKNMPAIVVGGDIIVDANDITVNMTGFVQVGNQIDFGNHTGVSINITGALYILGDGIIDIVPGNSVIVNASPQKSAIQTWFDADNRDIFWTPAGDALYQSITHVPPPPD